MLMDSQISKMHTRLRDGTVRPSARFQPAAKPAAQPAAQFAVHLAAQSVAEVIPVMDLYGDGIVDKPVPGHIFVEQPLIKSGA